MQSRKKFDVFLSHNSRDKPWVIGLKNSLETRKVKVWLDKDEIRPGDLFAEALERGIAESKAVALIVSPASMDSGWVKAEYYRALSFATNGKLQLIPVLYKNAEIPGFLSDRSWVDFSHEHEYEEKVELLVWGITGKKPARGKISKIKQSAVQEKTNPRRKEINLLLNQIKNPFVRDQERKLRMGNAHWLQAGFSRPTDEFTFTTVYYENQINSINEICVLLRKIASDISNREANLIQDSFLDHLEDNLNQIIVRIKQVEDVLSQKEFDLGITISKAGKTVLHDVEKVRKLAFYAPTKLLSNPREYDRISINLSTEVGKLSISMEQYQKYLKMIVNQAKLEKIYSS
jgi:hypothetical protein